MNFIQGSIKLCLTSESRPKYGKTTSLLITLRQYQRVVHATSLEIHLNQSLDTSPLPSPRLDLSSYKQILQERDQLW